MYVSAWLCVCVNMRGRSYINERSKFHINQKQIMENHRIKELSALKMALCPTNFEKSLLTHQECNFHPETTGVELWRFRGTWLRSRGFFFGSLSPPANNEHSEITLNI